MQEVFVTAFSLRLLPDRFLFHPRFTFRATESITSRTNQKKTHTLKKYF